MATLEQIIVETRSLSAAEKRELRGVLDRELEQTLPGRQSKPRAGNHLPSGRAPKSLRGLWQGKFPGELDFDSVLHEIRHEWEEEGPEVFRK